MRLLRHFTFAALLTLWGVGVGTAAATPTAPPQALNVLMFWSVHCGNCMPLLTRLSDVRQRFSGAPVRFIVVSIDEEENMLALQHVRQLGFEIIHFGGALVPRFEVPAVPWVLLTDCADRVVATPSQDNHPTSVPAYVEMELVFRGYLSPLPALRAASAASRCISAPGAGGSLSPALR